MIRYIGLFNFSAFLIYAFLMVFVVSKNRKALLNWVCAVFMSCGMIWSFSFIFVQNVYTPKYLARIFMNISSLGWINFSVIFLWFVLVFSKKKKNDPGYKILILAGLFAMVFNIRQWIEPINGVLEKQFFGWVSVWSDNMWLGLYLIHYTIVISIAVFYIISFGKQEGDKIEKKKINLIIFCLVGPVLAGSVVDIFLPKLNIWIVPAAADLIALIWGVGLIYAMVKYEYLKINPSSAAEKIISTMADSLVLVGPESRILDVNSYTLDLLGYKKEELLDRPFSFLFSGGKDEMPLKGRHLKELLKKETVREQKAVYRTKKGEKIPVNFSAAIIRDKEKNLSGIVFIARDMREMLRLIKKEKDLAVELAAREIEELKGTELRKAYKELQDAQNMLVQSEKLREMGQLGAGVVHELNNPLSGVLSLMRVYKKKYGPGSEEFEDLEEMEKGFEFMGEIVRSLSDFTRESSEAFVEVDCNEIIRSTADLIGIQMERKKIKVETDLCAELVKIKGDRRQLQQIIINLVNNARDAMFDGGILKIKSRNSKIDGKVFAEIEVEDTGCGMQEEIQKDVFTPFFTTKRPGGGIGLGLSVVHSIIKAHKGSVFVNSVKGKGSVFTIRIPANGDKL